MASWSKAILSSSLDPFTLFFSPSSTPISSAPLIFRASSYSSHSHSSVTKLKHSSLYPSINKTTTAAVPLSVLSFSFGKHICRMAEYKFPDPIPEFADAEIEKFRTHLLKKLPKKDIYGDSVEEVIEICTEIFKTFLHTEYGGPGTLLVIPFIDMADTVNERGLSGGPQAARAALKWAQVHVDKDWNEWTGSDSN